MQSPLASLKQIPRMMTRRKRIFIPIIIGMVIFIATWKTGVLPLPTEGLDVVFGVEDAGDVWQQPNDIIGSPLPHDAILNVYSEDGALLETMTLEHGYIFEISKFVFPYDTNLEGEIEFGVYETDGGPITVLTSERFTIPRQMGVDVTEVHKVVAVGSVLFYVGTRSGVTGNLHPAFRLF